MQSEPPAASIEPSGEKATALAPADRVDSGICNCPVLTDQTFTRLSFCPAEASKVPVALNEMDTTVQVWPPKVNRQLWLPKSQSLMVPLLNIPAEARYWPS